MEPILWQMLLAPLLVLPLMLLFRFVGCGLDVVGTGPAIPPAPTTPPSTTPTPTPEPPVVPPPEGIPVRGSPPNYRKYILGEQPNPGDVLHNTVVVDGSTVIGYWRLTDASAATVALDEQGARDGTYETGDSLNDVAPTGALGGSEAAPGTLLTGQPGLIVSDAAALSRFFNGGYVQIPFAAGLHTDEFTLEAWVNLTALKADYEHMLFDTGGRYNLPGPSSNERGYRVLADRAGNWQVRLTSTQVVVFATPPKVPLGGRTHFALVLKNTDAAAVKKDLTIYIDGKETVTQTVPSYSRPDTAPLFIAAENTAATPAQAVKMRAPFLGLIQEVVLHSKPLSQQEIENHVDINR